MQSWSAQNTRCTLQPAARQPGRMFILALDLAVNDVPTWRWELWRRWIDVVPPYDAGCKRDGSGRAVFMTSMHSVIVDVRERD